jgi:hypothetical protein
VIGKPVHYVGNPDFHDGHIRAASQHKDTVLVTVEGASGRFYTIGFDGVSAVESYSPHGMLLYALCAADADAESMHRYDFVNWYVDEPEQEESKSYLRIIANRLTITEAA